jgi:glycine/D-amino acid oxidase-like deaminating enzyme
VEWTTTDSDELPVMEFLRAMLPGLTVPARERQVCMYTLTPDKHFVLDRHPECANVLVAGGFSGHGFKFAPVVGETLADLATVGHTMNEISLFRVDRFTERT